MKKIILLSLVSVFTAGMLNFAWAEMGCTGGNITSAKEEGQTVATKEAVNVGNTICPVTGEKINEQTKATYEYNGKIYNFCCAMCIADFKNDPQKYISKVEEELKAQAPVKAQ